MNYPRIKPILYPFQTTKKTIILGAGQFGISSEIKDDETGNIWRLIQLLDGTKTCEQVVSEMQKISPGLSSSTIHQAINDLISKGFIEEAKPSKPSNLTPQELERYSRSTNFFAMINREVQDSPYVFQSRLKNSRVTILGLGGVGSVIAEALTAAGVGNLHLVDHDKVEVSNLNRQTLYKQKDVGKFKTEQAIKNLRELNPNVHFTGENLQVKTVTQIEALMRKADLFVLSADTPFFEIIRMVNKAALKTRTPWTRSSFTGPLIRASMMVPFETPCFECINHHNQQKRKIHPLDPNQELYPPQVAGGIGPIAQIAGQIIAFEIILFLAGFKPKLLGAEFRQSFLLLDYAKFTLYQFWAKCPACGSKKK